MPEPSPNQRDLKRELEDLLYVVAHHLKEPARSIRTSVELLLEELGAGGSSHLSASADRILRGVMRLDEIAASVARYADDLGSEDEEVVPTNMETVFRNIRQRLAPLIEQSRAIVTSDSLPRLRCQPTRVERLMEHLVRNAILYGREEVAPVVHVSAKKESDHWLFSITDNGTGVESEYIEQVFEPFRRLHSNEHHGLGMGLTTCRHIVARHGGRIWMQSQFGIGSTVFFTLPE
jgi:two-component system, sensor histidine kinase and response regulator